MPATRIKLTQANTAVRLSTALLNASGTGFTNPNPVTSLPNCKILTLKWEDNNTDVAYTGDVNLAPSAGTPIYGNKLQPGDAFTWALIANVVTFTDKYIASGSANLYMLVEWQY